MSEDMEERTQLFNSVAVADFRMQYDVLKDAVKNIHKLKVDLTVEEKKCLEMVHGNLVSEAMRILDAFDDMGQETIKGNDNLKMVKKYLENNLIDFLDICEEIMKLLP